MKKTLRALVVIGFSLLSITGNAQISGTPSAQQIAQFQKLPKAQQQMIAKQLGIDLSAFSNATNNTRANNNDPQNMPESQYYQEQEQLDELESEDVEKELKPFGYELFERSADAFLPQGSIPIPSDYVVGPGDQLQVSLFGKESSQHLVTIDNNGQLVIPNIEPLNVSGLTFSELKSFIANTVKTKLIGIQSTVSLANLRSIQVYVVGDVKRPGAYHLSSLSTITNALFTSGGPTEVGSLRNIQLKRAGKAIARLDLYDMLIRGNVSQDARIQQGDVIFVGAIDKQVSINGEVRRPAIYEVFGSENVADLISMAGGLNVDAYPKHAILARFDENYQRDVQKVNLKSDEVKSKLLRNGDILTVLPVSYRLDQVVNVAGAVSRPTTYAWSNGMSLSDVIVTKDDLMETTDLDYGLILSQESTGSYHIEQFKPREILQGKIGTLSPGDLVIFFNKFDHSTFVYEDDEDREAGRRLSELKELGLTAELEAQMLLDDASKDSEFNYLYYVQSGSLFEKTNCIRKNERIKPIGAN